MGDEGVLLYVQRSQRRVGGRRPGSGLQDGLNETQEGRHGGSLSLVGVGPVHDDHVGFRQHGDELIPDTESRIHAVIGEGWLAQDPPVEAVAHDVGVDGVEGAAPLHPVLREDPLLVPDSAPGEEESETGCISGRHAEGIGRVAGLVSLVVVVAVGDPPVFHSQGLGEVLVVSLEDVVGLGLLEENVGRRVEVPVVVGEVAARALATPGTAVRATGVGRGMEYSGSGLQKVQDPSLALRFQEGIRPVVDPKIRQRLVQVDFAPVPVDAVEGREEALPHGVAHESTAHLAPRSHHRTVGNDQEGGGRHPLPGFPGRLQPGGVEAGVFHVGIAHPLFLWIPEVLSPGRTRDEDGEKKGEHPASKQGVSGIHGSWASDGKHDVPPHWASWFRHR